MTKQLTIISAASFEVQPLKKLMPQLEFIECGIGCLNTAKNTQLLKKKTKNKDIIFVGSCGVFAEFDSTKLVTVNKIKWLPTCERMGLSETIENLHPDINLKTPKYFKELEQTTALTSAAISSDATINIKHQHLLRATLVENLEIYPLASAILPGVNSLEILLGITNAVGPLGRKQWRENFRKIAEISAYFIQNKLEAPSGFEPL
jgi:hypothetical protein